MSYNIHIIERLEKVLTLERQARQLHEDEMKETIDRLEMQVAQLKETVSLQALEITERTQQYQDEVKALVVMMGERDKAEKKLGECQAALMAEQERAKKIRSSNEVLYAEAVEDLEKQLAAERERCEAIERHRDHVHEQWQAERARLTVTLGKEAAMCREAESALAAAVQEWGKARHAAVMLQERLDTSHDLMVSAQAYYASAQTEHEKLKEKASLPGYVEPSRRLSKREEELAALKAQRCGIDPNVPCAELPEGWQIDISMERGAGWVSLYDPDGCETPFETGDRSMQEQVESAVARAKEGQ